MVHTGDPRLRVRPPWLTALFIRFILGMLIVLFFRCMAALFNPLYRRGEGIKWGLVSYTTIMFSLATVNIAMNIYIESISFIDNREFSGGPYAYAGSIYHNVINVVPNVAFCLNNWLADGLLVSFLFHVVVARTGA